MKKVFKSLFVFCLIIAAGGSFVSCSNSIWFNASLTELIGKDYYYDEGTQSNEGMLSIIRSIEDFNKLCEENNNTLEYDKYTEVYFSEKALVILTVAHHKEDLSITSLSVNKEILCVNIRSTRERWGVFESFLGYRSSFIIEVSKSDIAGVTSFKMKTKFKLGVNR